MIASLVANPPPSEHAYSAHRAPQDPSMGSLFASRSFPSWLCLFFSFSFLKKSHVQGRPSSEKKKHNAHFLRKVTDHQKGPVPR